MLIFRKSLVIDTIQLFLFDINLIAIEFGQIGNKSHFEEISGVKNLNVLSVPVILLSNAPTA